MEEIVLHKGTKDERKYILELDFNAVADSDVMEQFTESLKTVNELAPTKEKKDDRKVVPLDHQKKKKKEQAEEADNGISQESVEQMASVMPAIKRLFSSTRAILHACLQLHHEDEFRDVRDTGKLINEMLKKDENGKSEWDIMAVFTLAQNVLNNADSLVSLLGEE